MSLGTVIVEAGERSGALITADFALEQGREVMVVPGSILSPLSAGANELLKQGATPITSTDDILSALSLLTTESRLDTSVARHVPQLGPEEASVWHALGEQPLHVDELARLLGTGPGEVSAMLAMLELRGLARQVGAMLYTRA